MSHIENQSIPKTGFGLCRWCNEENQRLQYLMCSKCFRIANMLPSKTMVLLNRPEIKKRLGEEGATIRNIAPELRKFILDPKCRFPSEISDQNQWKTMQKVAVDNVTKTEEIGRASCRERV